MIIKTEREDGVIISTLKPTHFLAWYGNYETAVSIDRNDWRIVEGYENEQ